MSVTTNKEKIPDVVKIKLIWCSTLPLFFFFLQKDIIIEDCHVFVNPYEEADEEVLYLY